MVHFFYLFHLQNVDAIRMVPQGVHVTGIMECAGVDRMSRVERVIDAWMDSGIWSWARGVRAASAMLAEVGMATAVRTRDNAIVRQVLAG